MSVLLVVGRCTNYVPLEEQAILLEEFLKTHPETGLSPSDVPNWIPRIHNCRNDNKVIIGLNFYLPDENRKSGLERTLETVLDLLAVNIPKGMTFVNGIIPANVILNEGYVNYEPGVFWTVTFMDPESDENINSVVNTKVDPPVFVAPKTGLLDLISGNIKKRGSSKLSLEERKDPIIYESATSEVLMNVLWDFDIINPGNINRQTPSPVFKGYKLIVGGKERDYPCFYLNKGTEFTLDRYYTRNNPSVSYPKIRKIRCSNELGSVAQFFK